MRVERRRDLRTCTTNYRQVPPSPEDHFEQLLKRLIVANTEERAARTAGAPSGVAQAPCAPEPAVHAGRVPVGAGASTHRLPRC